MDILIVTKNDNIEEIYNYILKNIPKTEEITLSKTSSDLAIVSSNNYKIRIREFNKSRGFRGRIVLYSGDFTKEEMLDLEILLTPNEEHLLAPIGSLKYLLHNDIIYIVTGGERDCIDMQLITKDLTKALARMNDGHYHQIRAYKEDSDEEILYDSNDNPFEYGLLKNSWDILKYNTTLD